MQRTVEVVDYNPQWPNHFQQLKDRLLPLVETVALSIEHVGSTSVQGLAAKPVIDIDIVIPTADQLPIVIEQLAKASYVHQGNLGIEGRDAFKGPAVFPRHNLYVCTKDSLGLRNHLALRGYLRQHPDAILAYGVLKKQLAEQFPTDIGSYCDGKTDFIVGILREVGLASQELISIETVNRL